MSINIYKDQMEYAEVFGKPVLYTTNAIPREKVPEKWHCYDLCGTDRNPFKPSTITDHAIWDRIGTILSPVPLKRESTDERKVKDFLLSGEGMNLSTFCQERGLTCPSDPRKFILRPASREEAGLFYAETENYRFCLRCSTLSDDYSYLYCYFDCQSSKCMECL